jgi:hypothetical protein
MYRSSGRQGTGTPNDSRTWHHHHSHSHNRLHHLAHVGCLPSAVQPHGLLQAMMTHATMLAAGPGAARWAGEMQAVVQWQGLSCWAGPAMQAVVQWQGLVCRAGQVCDQVAHIIDLGLELHTAGGAGAWALGPHLRGWGHPAMAQHAGAGQGWMARCSWMDVRQHAWIDRASRRKCLLGGQANGYQRSSSGGHQPQETLA